MLALPWQYKFSNGLQLAYGQRSGLAEAFHGMDKSTNDGSTLTNQVASDRINPNPSETGWQRPSNRPRMHQFAALIFSEQRADIRLATGPKLQWISVERCADGRPKTSQFAKLISIGKGAGNQLATGLKMRQSPSRKLLTNRSRYACIFSERAAGKQA